MTSSILAILLILSLTQVMEPADALSGITKREISISGVLGSLACIPKLSEKASECDRVLREQTKPFERENPGEISRCCYFAAFRLCVWLEAKKECGDDASEVVDTVVGRMQSAMSQECGTIQWYAPQCLFILWLPHIIIGSIILLLIIVGCCLGACCCR